MDQDRLDRLTEMQRKCLRLVYAHLSSKEIAPRLGIEPGTVDQYLKAAMRILGVTDRRTAALMLAEHEHARGQPLVYQPSDIAGPGDPANKGASTEGRRETASGGAMREEPALYMAFSPAQADPFSFPLPIRGAEPGDLGTGQRLVWISLLILLIALAFGAFVAGIEALSRLGRALG
jgi:DNA-binding CsgD family transcriptional regulator